MNLDFNSVNADASEASGFTGGFTFGGADTTHSAVSNSPTDNMDFDKDFDEMMEDFDSESFRDSDSDRDSAVHEDVPQPVITDTPKASAPIAEIVTPLVEAPKTEEPVIPSPVPAAKPVKDKRELKPFKVSVKPLKGFSGFPAVRSFNKSPGVFKCPTFDSTKLRKASGPSVRKTHFKGPSLSELAGGKPAQCVTELPKVAEKECPSPEVTVPDTAALSKTKEALNGTMAEIESRASEAIDATRELRTVLNASKRAIGCVSLQASLAAANLRLINDNVAFRESISRTHNAAKRLMGLIKGE